MAEKEIPKIEGRTAKIETIMKIEDYWFPEEKRYRPAYLYSVRVEGIPTLIHIAIPVEEYSEDRLKAEIKKAVEEYLKGLPKTPKEVSL